MFRAVFFDAGGVLLYVPRPWPARFASVLGFSGHSVTAEEVQAARDKMKFPPWPRTLEEEEQYWPIVYAAVLKELSIGLPNHDELHQQVWWVHHARLFNDAVPTLEALRSRGLRVGLISNASPSMQVVLERLGILMYFDSVVISDVLGILKPDPRIFEHALNTMSVDASEASFVDDTLENVVAAQELGMTALLLERSGSESNRLGVIRSLSEILSVV